MAIAVHTPIPAGHRRVPGRVREISDAEAIAERLDFRGLLAEGAGAFRERWPTLLLAGLPIFAALGLIDALGYNELELDDDVDAVTLAKGLAQLGIGVSAVLLGKAVYTGFVARLVVAEREGTNPSIGMLLQRFSLVRLLVLDLLVTLAIVAGLVALVVPGFLLLAWFALAAPALEVEELNVADALRRSRELVRGHVWAVLGLVVPLLIAESAVTDGAQAALGGGFGGDWVGAVLGSLVTAPVYAVAVTVLFLELRRQRPVTGRGPQA